MSYELVSWVKPIADRVAQHLEIISKNFQFSTRCTRILMGCTIYYLVLIVNPMGRILVRWNSFTNNLEMLCHPICNWLYTSHAGVLIHELHMYTKHELCHELCIWVTNYGYCIHFIQAVHTIHELCTMDTSLVQVYWFAKDTCTWVTHYA